jgi:hypothetical protein
MNRRGVTRRRQSTTARKKGREKPHMKPPRSGVRSRSHYCSFPVVVIRGLPRRGLRQAAKCVSQ